jgi:hypothetical protein
LELEARSGFEVIKLIFPSVLSDGVCSNQLVLHRYFEEQFSATLTQKVDVMVLPSFLFSKIIYQHSLIMENILQKCRDGTGLVIVQPDGRWYQLKDRSIFKDYRELSPIHDDYGKDKEGTLIRKWKDNISLVSSLSFADVPQLYTGNNKLDKDAIPILSLRTSSNEVIPLVALFNLNEKRGRVVDLHYYTYNSTVVPYIKEPDQYFDDWYEVFMGLFIQAILWAAEREPLVKLEVPDNEVVEVGKGAVIKISLAADKKKLPFSGELEYKLQDVYGALEGSGSTNIHFTDAKLDVFLKMPVLYVNGYHRVNIWLKNVKGEIENFGMTFVKIENGGELFAESEKKYLRRGVDRFVTYKVIAKGADGILCVKGQDDIGRNFFEISNPFNGESTITVDLSRVCLPHNVLDFSVIKDGLIKAHKMVNLYVPQIGRDDNTFIISSYGDTRLPLHLAKYAGALYREAGFNAVYFNWHQTERVRYVAHMGLDTIIGAGWSARNLHEYPKVLKECPNNPVVQSRRETIISNIIEDIKVYGGLSRVLDDESYFAYTGAKGGQQACQCEYCVKLFREAMQRKYKDIKSLNNCWGTDFRGFDELRVIEEDEIRDKDNPSAWLEFRQYMNWTYSQYFKWVNQKHSELGEKFGAGVGAPFWTRREGGPTYRGGDYSFLKDTIPFMMAYGGTEARRYVNAFVGQPGGQKYDPPMWWIYGPWYMLLNGADALWFYYGDAIIGQEIAFRKHAEWVKEGVKGIDEGIGVLFNSAQPCNEDVCILYSPESMAMAWLFCQRKDEWSSLKLKNEVPFTEYTMVSLLDNLMNIDSRWISTDEIKKGGLKKCKLLIMPQVLNLDDETATAIKNYVQNGGNVLADILPATREQFGKPRTNSALSEVFGVDFSNAKIWKEEPAWECVLIGKEGNNSDGFIKNPTWLSGFITFDNVNPTTSSSQGYMLSNKREHKADVCFLNSYGKGKAILLNFIYSGLDMNTFKWHIYFGEAICEWAGLKPYAKIEDKNTKDYKPYHNVKAYQYDKTMLFGFLRGTLEWIGGPTLIDYSRSIVLNDEIGVSFYKSGHLYDVRAGTYLGATNYTSFKLPSFNAKVISMLPYKVEDLIVELPDLVVKKGEPLSFDVKIKTSNNSVPGKHILFMKVISPTGYHQPLYNQTRKSDDGIAHFTIPFANNDRMGEWKIIVKDVLSGLECERKVLLK